MTKGVRTALTLSLLLNLLLIGAGAGYFIHCRDFMHGVRPEDMAQLSPDGKALLKDSFAKTHEALHPVFEQAKAARATVISVLEDDSFNPVRFINESNHLRQLQNQIMEARTRTAAELAAKLSQSDRTLLAEWLAGPGGKPPSPHYYAPPKAGAVEFESQTH
jgi:uncharacterized membrane protein